jgi:hypothetical protein
LWRKITEGENVLFVELVEGERFRVFVTLSLGPFMVAPIADKKART